MAFLLFWGSPLVWAETETPLSEGTAIYFQGSFNDALTEDPMGGPAGGGSKQYTWPKKGIYSQGKVALAHPKEPDHYANAPLQMRASNEVRCYLQVKCRGNGCSPGKKFPRVHISAASSNDSEQLDASNDGKSFRPKRFLHEFGVWFPGGNLNCTLWDNSPRRSWSEADLIQAFPSGLLAFAKAGKEPPTATAKVKAPNSKKSKTARR